VDQTSQPAESFIDGASAVVLAGGKSSRMGRPKALLPFGDEPLIVHIVRALKRIFAEIVVVAAPGQEMPALPVKLVRDEVAYQGPVGGIYYGLKATGGKFSFVTSCDVAFVSSTLISYLTSQISQHDVVVPYWQDRFQPLHAVYRRSVLPFLESQLERGELRPVYLFDKVRTRRVAEEEIRRFDPQGLSFFNMNTPDDYERALKRWNEIRQSEEAATAPADSAAVSSFEPSVICTVELFGAVRLLAKTREVSLALPQGATLADVYSALAANLPILLGRVITADRTNLLSGYACNINGLNFIRSPSAIVHSGDKIFILSADAGG
jgi:molybdopterin-guanine dinucleotide biosynthesis protein A/molybdopterin converting factor small subunit